MKLLNRLIYQMIFKQYIYYLMKSPLKSLDGRYRCNVTMKYLYGNNFILKRRISMLNILLCIYYRNMKNQKINLYLVMILTLVGYLLKVNF